jgi:hypothetical protein
MAYLKFCMHDVLITVKFCGTNLFFITMTCFVTGYLKLVILPANSYC